ncbi:MAG TPA: hypothetical protein ENH31_00310 [Nitrospirae bacterium]|nr:hypothetical protein [Nitrospirota bacterium]HDK80994.1 hypothetical protein [Nitrospirota bacterium]
MSQVKCCAINILETSSVSLSAGTEDPDYPLYRLYDRDIGKLHKITAAVTMEVKIDQGSTGNLAIDRLLIPAGHNLDGMTLDFEYSDDDAAYTPGVTQWVQSGNGLIDKAPVLSTHRYWLFRVNSPSSIPEIPELFLTLSKEWIQNPSLPWDPLDDEFNVEHDQTAGGQDRFLIHGDPKKQRNYAGYKVEDTQKDDILEINNAWAGAKPFFLCDHNGVWIYGMLTQRIMMRQEDEHESGGLYSFDFPFREVLA